MSQIVLLRHGQASFGAENYDQLSENGYRQAEILGQQWRALGELPTSMVVGSMARHFQTAESVLKGVAGIDCEPAMEVHSGLNEYNFRVLLQSVEEQTPEVWCDTGHARRDYFQNMKNALQHWAKGRITTDGDDTWSSYRERVVSALEFALSLNSKRTVLVSSGGTISVILAHLLGLDVDRTIDISMQLRNTSTSTLLYNRSDITVASINDVSHLRTTEYQSLITYA